MSEAERVEVGFEGGQVIPVRLDTQTLKELRKSLENGKGWLDVHTEDGVVSVDLSRILFLRIASLEHKVGFSS